MDNLGALILAAGKGTRMHSATPKVLQKILGEPMLGLVQANLKPLFGENIYTVAGHGLAQIQKAFPNSKLIVQEEQLGTAHAVKVALPTLLEQGFRHVLIINGDTPLVSSDLLTKFLEKARDYDLAVATLELKDPAAYGRIVRENGSLKAIVEAKDYNVEIYGEPSGEINAGLYCVSLELLTNLLPQISQNALSGEYYLTDLVAKALACQYKVTAISCGQDSRLLGVNSPKELVELEEWLRAEIVNNLLASGVLIHAPKLVRISPLAKIAKGAEISGPCEIYGPSEIASDAIIESNCVIKNSVIDSFAEIRSFSHLDQAKVGRGCLVGPFARLRPGALLEAESHVGNFVELKKAHLGLGAKANHLTYLGDAEIGAHTNIGAGTITCNYDGKHKHQTTIGEKAFIGSNTALVAPVKVGAGAMIGAGSTITHDIPDDHLAVSRSRQKNFPHKPFTKEG